MTVFLITEYSSIHFRFQKWCYMIYSAFAFDWYER